MIELRAGGRVDDRRRPPRRQLLPIRLPHRFSRLGIQREQERVGLCVALHDHQAIPDNRRAGGPPLVRRDVVGAHVDTAKIDGPAQAAVEVVGMDPLRSEPCDDDAAIGGGGAARIGGLDVPLVAWFSLGRRSLPADLSRALVDRVQHPAMRRSIVRGIAVAVEAGLERGVRAAADGARHEEHVAPDDRAGVRKPGNRRPPQDVRAGGRAPVVRQVLSLGAAGRFVSAERWPVAGAVRRRRQCAFRRAAAAHNAARLHRRLNAARQPLAAIENHPSRLAVVRDQVEADTRAVDREGVASRAGAVLGAVL